MGVLALTGDRVCVVAARGLVWVRPGRVVEIWFPDGFVATASRRLFVRRLDVRLVDGRRVRLETGRTDTMAGEVVDRLVRRLPADWTG